MTSRSTKHLDEIFHALADPTRRAIIRQLAKGETTVGRLELPVALAPATLSKHLRVLERSGLIEQARDGRFLRTRLRPTRLWTGLDWLEELRSIWDDQLDQLEVFLERERGKGRP
ncbi:MAG: ArsR/SmtB family transcription factor [Vicinamibacterales bacterium]